MGQRSECHLAERGYRNRDATSRSVGTAAEICLLVELEFVDDRRRAHRSGMMVLREEHLRMGIRNYLIDGGSGTGKTTVCDELQRRGYQAIHGDRELRGEPESGEGGAPEHHRPPRWDVAKVKALLANQEEALTFFCGGCRNSSEFINLLDGVFVLEVDDLATVMRRIDERVLADPSDWGGRQAERDVIMRLHHTKDGLAEGYAVDATPALQCVVDEILRRVRSDASSPQPES